MSFTVHRIPAFTDNYLWLIEGSDKQCCVVDPGDAQVVLETLQRLDLSLEAILVTHHHPDHTGGIDELCRAYECKVYGPDSRNIPQVEHKLGEGDSIVACGISFKIIEVPGHTLDHIAYLVEDLNNNPSLFCGDTLFAGGCGRIFEGTPDQMYASLSRLGELPGDTTVYCAHEYTQANLKFALAVEPGNEALIERNERVIEQRSAGIATVPTNIALELATNPFLRCNNQSLANAAKLKLGHSPENPLQTFATIRRWKDEF